MKKELSMMSLNGLLKGNKHIKSYKISKSIAQKEYQVYFLMGTEFTVLRDQLFFYLI